MIAVRCDLVYGLDVPIKAARPRVQDVMVDLINSGPQGDQVDLIGDAADLERLMRAWIITEASAPSEIDVERLHRFRARLRAVVVAPQHAVKIEIVNALLTGADVHPRLIAHDGLALHIHYFAPYASVSDHLVADCAMELALMFESGESERLRECAAPDCGTVFVDRSKNRSRLYCSSQTCGNRLHAAAYRARATAAAV